MALTPGTRLGPYEIIAQIGAGGMGEVYSARDTRLDRIVAIKTINSELTDLRERFEREAKAISALQHPHICVLHDVGHLNGVQFLVMEHLEGETLAERLRRGPLPLPELLRCAIQIVSALQAAHARAIIHRDLKPANVILTSSGAKLLDFGLARVLPSDKVGDHESLLVTREQNLTRQGTLLGTFQYMAPEQLEAREVDARTDIFALGALMYEMATARKAFEGASQASLIAKILEAHPVPLSDVNPATPPALDHLVRVCLAKSPGDRWQTAQDVLTQLRWIADEGVRAAASVPTRTATWRWPIVAALVCLTLATVTILAFRRFATVPVYPAGRFDVALPDELGPVIPAIAPDARRVVFAGTRADRQRLWVRSLSSSTVVAIPGTEDAALPFWSPDGASIAFFADSRLKRVPATGGTVVTLCDAPNPGGGSWGASGDIVFASDGVIRRVSEAGGAPAALTVLDNARGDVVHSFPTFVPDSRHVLFLADGKQPGVYAVTLDSSQTRQILSHASSLVLAVRPGYLLFVEQQNLMAQAFDLRRLTLRGQPLVVASSVPNWAFSASQDVLVFSEIPSANKRIAWFDRSGRRLGTVGEAGRYRQVVLAPGGRRAVLEREEDTRNVDLWMLDGATGALSRLTQDPALDADTAWAPDETRIVFSSRRLGKSSLFVKDLRTGQETTLLQTPDSIVADDWSADGQWVIYRTVGRAVFALPMQGARTPRLLIDTPFVEDQTHLSPDGTLIAFNSNESGRWEVYVARFPEFTDKRQLSTGGGVQPLWRRDGRELFFVTLNGQLMTVDITRKAGFESSVPRPLFETALGASPAEHEYGVTPDGQRFLVIEPAETRRDAVTFMTNWTAGWSQ